MSGTRQDSVVALPVRLVGAGVASVGGVALLLWAARPGGLGALTPGGAPTHPATAVALLCIGVVLAVPGLARRPRVVLLLIAGVVAVDGLLALVAGRGLVFGDPLVPEVWRRGTLDGDGRMALGTSLGLLGLAGGIASLRRNRRVATAAAMLAFAIGYIAILGHLFGVLGPDRSETFPVTPVPVAAAVLAGSLALAFHDHRMPLHRLLHAPGTPGALVRRLLPAAVLLPPVIRWLVLQGQQADLYSPRFGLALMALATLAGTAGAVLIGARTAAGIDRSRERTMGQLTALNASLAERIAAAVAESEQRRERLALLLERMPVGIFETGPDGRRRYTNRRWRELTGVEGGEDVGSRWHEALHPDDRERVLAMWTRAMRSGDEFSARYRYLRPDGQVTWVDCAAISTTGPADGVPGWLGSVTDVTEQVLAGERLAESERRYRSVVTAMAEGVLLQDPDGRILTANESACRLLGMSLDEMTSREGADPAWNLTGEDGELLPPEACPSRRTAVSRRPVRDVVVGARRGDGGQVWLAINAEPLFAESDDAGEGAVVGVVTTFADVTEARTAAAALRRSEEQFRDAMTHAPIGMALVELDGRCREVNQALCRIVGYAEDELVGSDLQQVTHPDDLEDHRGDVERLLAGEVDHYSTEKRYLTKRGEVVRVLLAVSCARGPDGLPTYLVMQIQDVTAAHELKEQLTHRALHDPLTGLPNRDLLMDHLAHALARSTRLGSPTAVMFLDLDAFKQINDTLGHDVGDELLVAVAERLRSAVRPGDVVARLGGDEFVVVAERLPDAGAARGFAERIRRSLAEPVVLGGSLVEPGASVGVALATTEDDARSVLREADAAMYRAKALGRGRVELSSSGWGEQRPEPQRERTAGSPA